VTSRLTVSPNGRYLLKEDGTPFFYLGDTAWELFHRLNREEAKLYLENRAAKGFTVIQAVVLAELDGLNTPNPYGHTPLHDNDPTRPNEAYFQHVDDIVEMAAQLGLYVGMLPTWGDKVHWLRGDTPEIFTPETARSYGEFLGQRYRNQPMIWILGGDRDPRTDRHLAIWQAMAAGLKAGDGGTHLMTFHCQSNSARWFHQADWLDFNMIQSGHGEKNCPCYQVITENYHRTPAKPTLNGEPCYEDIPVRFWENDYPRRKWNALPIVKQISRYQRGVFDAFDVRQAAYWSLLAGALGHTYGHNSVWQMWEPGRLSFVPAEQPWHEALDRPGAVQMGYVRRLFESRPFTKLVPDPGIIENTPDKGAAYTNAARAEDSSFLFAYTPTGKPIALNLNLLKGIAFNASWYNPRTGEAEAIGTFSGQGQVFYPPSQGRGNDWVLVLDDIDCGFSPPGEGGLKTEG
jgi:hypothetical protein